MRMRLTPDCSKMLISTSSGYLLILHDLDLNKSLEVGSYPILRARRTTSSSGECCSAAGAVLGCFVGAPGQQPCGLISLLLFADITSSGSSGPRAVGSPCHQNNSGPLSEKTLSRPSQREGRKRSVQKKINQEKYWTLIYCIQERPECSSEKLLCFVLWILKNGVAGTSIKPMKSHCTPKPGGLFSFCVWEIWEKLQDLYFK